MMNLFPLVGLLIAAWGLYGLFAPDRQAKASAAQDDPSLEARGFVLPATEAPISFNRSWVKLDADPAEGQPAAPTSAAPSATPLPAATRSTDRRGLARISEPQEPPAIPDRIVIAAIGLDAPVVIAPTRTLTLQEQVFEQWLAPDDFAVGYHTGSAYLGKPGNTVLNGHHNVFGQVFARLVELQSGDEIVVYTGERAFRYVVAQSMVLKERGATLAEREVNAQWILPSDDERLTLVTCWPATNNTHRLLIVASPID